QVVLVTDTHAAMIRNRIRTLWGDQINVLDLFSPPIGAWTDPGDEPGGFARTHPERWRESLGQAQINLEQQGDSVSARQRWVMAHVHLCNPDKRFHFDIDDHNRFLEECGAIPLGQILTVLGDRPIKSDPFWRAVIAENHTAISPDGMGAAITWARPLTEPVVMPVRVELDMTPSRGVNLMGAGVVLGAATLYAIFW
ncbi:MAG: hypothetical protein IID14_08335, partial [Candidatus Marinimicrobia bacterium]|nr:hypothetical protein [Candidatus Neomarinimicrobiota bacterium]